MMTATRDLYTELDVALTASGIPSSAAEIHGTITGILCADPAVVPKQGVTAVRDNLENFGQSSMDFLEEIFTLTVESLKDDQFGFFLLLPSDDTALDFRAEALAAWCRGFLYGYGLMGEKSLSRQSREILHDLAEISRLDPSVEGEEDENAYTELVEFVRVGTQLLNAESVLAVEKEKNDE